jgi:hypothetical protein
VRLPGRAVRHLREFRHRPVPLRFAKHYLDQADADNSDPSRCLLDLGWPAPLSRLDMKQQPRYINVNGASCVGIGAARVLQFAAHVGGKPIGDDHAEPGLSRHRSEESGRDMSVGS